MSHHVIAIDGPAASGKSSVARGIAGRLGFAYVNSGEMYRAIAWKVARAGVSAADPEAVTRAIRQWRIEIGLADLVSFIRIDGEDPAPFLRDEEINRIVSAVSSVQAVRDVLLIHLRAYASNGHVVMEGRDIGSTVFPGTPFKFYIDASPEVRRQRREAQGQKDEISRRDRADASRRSSPLVIAGDAEVIDSSHLTIDGVIGEIIGRLKQKGLDIS